MTKTTYNISITCHYMVEADSLEQASDLFRKASKKEGEFPHFFDLMNIQEIKDYGKLSTDNILNHINS